MYSSEVIDRDISLAKNDIDEISLWLKMILTEISLRRKIILIERVYLKKQSDVL